MVASPLALPSCSFALSRIAACREIMASVSNIVLPSCAFCAFCAFLRGEKPYTILRRGELAAILVTREQRGASHLLVVPVRHCPTILDLRDEESGALMNEIRHAARIVDAAEKRPGIAVWQNNGLSANQAVAHVHFHVAGTLEEGGTRWGEVPRLSVAETDAIAERLRQAEASRQDE
jgi:histidine triad (HIT) family protein